MDYKKTAEELLEYTKNSSSPFHTVEYAAKKLKDAGFEKLDLNKGWNLKFNSKYFAKVYDSTLFAFTTGSDFADEGNIHFAAAHTDFPAPRIKSSCDINEKGYTKINVEMYGGAIYSTWFDRPLSVAGKVAVASEKGVNPETVLIDVKRPVAIIPSLAIHMNRDANKGIEWDAQKDLLPLVDIDEENSEDKKPFIDFLAEYTGVKKEDILDYELTLYACEEGGTIGLKDTLLSSPRLDNITSVKSCVDGIINGTRKNGLNIISLFDNEEIGSKTKQGAGSMLTNIILERIYLALGFSKEKLLCDITNGIMASVDVGHCVHPNYTEKNDITTECRLNGGVVLKKDSSQAYANDCEGIGIAKNICKAAGVPCQEFSNRSGGRSGSTLGSIATTMLPMRVMDIGVPLLAMHSARELTGVKDQYYLDKMLVQFFS